MRSRLKELAGLFLKLGTISFGGPAVHVGLMEDEIVARRQWLSHEQFLDLLGATYLIPGPNALEMAAHVGYRRAGLPGLLVASVCFTVPAAAITAALAWAYARYGALPEVGPFLQGIKPAVLAVILAAVCRLGKTALRSWTLAAIGLGVAAAAILGAGEIMSLLAGSLIGMLLLRLTHRPSDEDRPAETPPGPAAGLVALAGPQTVSAAPVLVAGTAGAAVPLWQLTLFFLKVGALLYGSGYILIAYLEGGLVRDTGWLSSEQLMDAVAAGQVTPGPLISTATFVGYLLAGWPGAALATAAIILPGLVLVAVTSPYIPRLRRSPWTARFLDAIGAASVGVTAAVTVTLARSTLVDWQSVALALVSAAVLLRWKLSPAWLVLAGSLAGRVLW